MPRSRPTRLCSQRNQRPVVRRGFALADAVVGGTLLAIGAGFLLGWIGSESAVRRFLKQVSLH